MPAPKLTDWFPPTTPPYHRGWYDTRLYGRKWLGTGISRRHWHNGQWYWSEDDSDPCHSVAIEWRGLAEITVTKSMADYMTSHDWDLLQILSEVSAA